MTGDEQSPIEASVARVLNERELVLNKGVRDGVRLGMRFAILNRNAVDIRDPVTHEILGSVPVAKTIVKIVLTEDRLAIGRTFRTIKGRTGAFTIATGLAGEPSRAETLRSGEKSVLEELSEEESAIKTGDPAIQAFGDEYTVPEL